jgi:hypothetical protein
MAETMMLAFDRRYENTSLGARLKYQDQAYFRRKAEEYGFGIAGFRSFDLPLSDAGMERIRAARAQSPADTSHTAAFEDYGNINRVLLEQHTGAEPPATAFYGDTCVSYDEAYQQIARYAAVYAHLGCGKGDRIAVLAERGDRVRIRSLWLSSRRRGGGRAQSEMQRWRILRYPCAVIAEATG